MELLYIVLANIVFISASGRQIKVYCPSYCECDLFLNYKRATCVNKTLVDIELDLPPQTQILDISYNQISQLSDFAFSKNNLLQLKSLNISHNKLSQIHAYAFDRLKELSTLDLSYNTVQYILPEWFVSLSKLEVLVLQGNYFGDMSNLQKYAFNSNSLKMLDLSKSYISYVTTDVFKLPNLEYLDMSGNQLMSINQRVISPLKNLRVLRISNNTFSCNKGMNILKKLTERRRIEYDDPCKNNKTKKFEKMILESTTQSPILRKFWMIQDNIEESTNDELPNITCKSFNKPENSLILLSEFPYTLLIITVLMYGILIGFICGCGIKSCRTRHKIRNYRVRNPVRLKRIKLIDEETHQLTVHADILGTSTPILIRK